MITRIVKLSFEDSYCVEFEANFFETKKIVLSNKGCYSVELLKSYEPGLYFTYSVWDNEDSLNHYRNSPVFKKIWGSFKPNFKTKAQAWTTKNISP
ncbi:MAG: heme-degrading monooxygenase HmoA [Saprospiraceae bacterium]|jgi:heme-degrading monooxygenase HmoA